MPAGASLRPRVMEPGGLVVRKVGEQRRSEVSMPNSSYGKDNIINDNSVVDLGNCIDQINC